MSDIVLYFSGGAMQGIYSEGVADALCQAEFYEPVEAVYGCSAGVFSGAYYLSGETRMAATIYFEELTDGFIRLHRLPLGYLERLWDGYVSSLQPSERTQGVDIDYMIDVMRHEKELDEDAVHERNIQFNVKVLDTQTRSVEYLNARENTLDTLHKASSIIPYYHPVDDTYVDAGITDPIGLPSLLEQHPESRIVVVLNMSANRKLRYRVRNYVEALPADAVFDTDIWSCFMEREDNLRRDIELARDHERVTLLHPPEAMPVKPWTTDANRLRTGFHMGQDAGRALLSSL